MGGLCPSRDAALFCLFMRERSFLVKLQFGSPIWGSNNYFSW